MDYFRDVLCPGMVADTSVGQEAWSLISKLLHSATQSNTTHTQKNTRSYTLNWTEDKQNTSTLLGGYWWPLLSQ